MSHAAAVARGTDVAAPASLDAGFSIAFQHSPQPSTIARLTEGTLLEANQSFCELIGRRRDQILGQSTHALGVWTNALERQRALSAVRLGQSFTIPRHWIRCSNGERRLCRISVLPITLDDELHLVSHFTDITTEHRAQVRLDEGTRILEAALASTRDAVCVVDAHQQVVQFNDALMRLHGFESREQCRAALESPWKSFEVLAADGRTLSFSEWPLARVGRGESVVAQDYAIRRLDDQSLVHCSISFAPIVSDDGDHLGCILTARDSGEQREEEQRIRKQQQDLERQVRERTADLATATRAAESANRAKTAFLANISHDIRTPLHGIVTLAAVIRSLGTTTEQAECLDKLDTASTHLTGLINAVLDLSRIEAGRLELDERPFALGALVDDVESITRDRARARGIDLAFQYDASVPMLIGDPVRLQQALLNLVGNAIKFTPSGRVDVQIDTVRVVGTGRLLRFEVRDTGIGIDPGTLRRLFTAFEQGHSDEAGPLTGSGLGLAITRRLARLMGGEAGANSKTGAGSTFWFTAWVRDADTDRSDPSTVQANAGNGLPRPPLDASARRGLEPPFSGRVLLVEDDPTSRKMLAFLLARTGLMVDTAIDGMEAVEWASLIDYQLILMDMRMPRMDGPTAAMLINRQSKPSGVPIIALTANAFEPDRQACIDAGMCDFISKPVSPAHLIARIGFWLQSDPRSPGFNGSNAHPLSSHG